MSGPRPLAAVLAAAATLALAAAAAWASSAPKGVRFPASDALTVTAEVYEPAGDAKTAPFIVLMHQAGSSRGEYRAIAPKLADRGFTALALDQRSGDRWGAVENETVVRALAKGMKTTRNEVLKDVEGALAWRAAQGYTGPLVLWGSSYSASLAFFVANRHPETRAIVAFSPGDYIAPMGATAREAAKVSEPAVLIVAPAKERIQAQDLLERLATKRKRLHVDEAGVHGASTLDRSPEREKTWAEIWAFLEAAGVARR